MSEHAASSSGSIINKRNAGIVALTGAGLGTLAYAPDQVSNVVGTTAGLVGTVLEMGGEAINNGVSTLAATAGINAPFAAPMIAGGYIGKKISDFAGFQSKWAKGASIGIGAFAGAATTASAAAPYLTAVAAGTLAYKGIQWALGKNNAESH